MVVVVVVWVGVCWKIGDSEGSVTSGCCAVPVTVVVVVTGADSAGTGTLNGDVVGLRSLAAKAFWRSRVSCGLVVMSPCSSGEATTFMATWFWPAKKRASPTSAVRRRCRSPCRCAGRRVRCCRCF